MRRYRADWIARSVTGLGAFHLIKIPDSRVSSMSLPSFCHRTIERDPFPVRLSHGVVAGRRRQLRMFDLRHIVKRSSELNATWMRALGLAAGALWLSACPALTTYAAPPTDADGAAAPNAQHSAEHTLSRDDVDKLLNQARTAIAAGNLDQAEALVERAEKTHIRYPLFHFGPTPSSVRHELAAAQAQHSTGGAEKPRRRRRAGASDPFAQRPLPMPAAQASAQMPTDANDSQRGVMPAIYDQPAGQSNRYVNQVAATGPAQNRGADKPEAPMPPSLRSTSTDSEIQPDNLGRSLHNNFTDAVPASNAAPSTPSPKAQTIELLRQARQALAAGNLDQAEAAARQAASLGVPESMFLPSEDKPSLLAWEIHQARANEEIQAAPVAQPVVPAAVTISDPNDRYVKQTRSNPERDTTRNIRATTVPPGVSEHALRRGARATRLARRGIAAARGIAPWACRESLLNPDRRKPRRDH